MAFTQRQNRLTTHFSERIPVVKRRIFVMPFVIKCQQILAVKFYASKTRLVFTTITALPSWYSVGDWWHWRTT